MLITVRGSAAAEPRFAVYGALSVFQEIHHVHFFQDVKRDRPFTDIVQRMAFFPVYAFLSACSRIAETVFLYFFHDLFPIVEILNRVDRTSEKAIIETLEVDNPELTEEIKKLMFVFEDIVMIDDRSIQRILRDVDRKDLIFADPMNATGGSLVTVVKYLQSQGVRPKSIAFFNTISTLKGSIRVTRALENCTCYTLWMDPVMNEKAYIMPGLGDAGDRLNGCDTKDAPRNMIQLIADYGHNISGLYKSQLYEIEKIVLG